MGLVPGNIYENQVLCIGGAQLSRGVLLRQIGSHTHLLGSNASAKHRGSNVKQSALALLVNANMIPEYVGRYLLCACGLKVVSQPALQFLQECCRRPPMPQESIFQARAFSV